MLLSQAGTRAKFRAEFDSRASAEILGLIEAKGKEVVAIAAPRKLAKASVNSRG